MHGRGADQAIFHSRRCFRKLRQHQAIQAPHPIRERALAIKLCGVAGLAGTSTVPHYTSSPRGCLRPWFKPATLGCEEVPNRPWADYVTRRPAADVWKRSGSSSDVWFWLYRARERSPLEVEEAPPARTRPLLCFLSKFPSRRAGRGCSCSWTPAPEEGLR